MIATPKTYCPLCGRFLAVLETVKVARYAEQVTYRCECGGGEADLLVERGKILSVTLVNPEKHPDFRILAG